MAKRSAGILLYRLAAGAPQLLLAHPGGPFWSSKDEGAWSIPKGELQAGEDPKAAALREFEEELGSAPPAGRLIDLGTVTQAGGKVVAAWAAEGDLDPAQLRSNTFTTQWPPRSGQLREFPEIDRVQWFGAADAMRMILPAQAAFIERLLELLGAG